MYFFFHSNEVAICEAQFFITPLTKNIHTSPKIILGPHKCFQHTQLWLSQIFPILLPNLGPHKYFSYHYQNWTTKLYHLYKGPHSFILWAKSKKPKHSYQAHCYTTLIKAHCYMTLLQSPLLQETLTKPVATWNS